MNTLIGFVVLATFLWLLAKVARLLHKSGAARDGDRYLTIEPNGKSFAVRRMGKSIPDRVFHPGMRIIALALQGNRAVVNFDDGRSRIYNVDSGSFTETR